MTAAAATPATRSERTLTALLEGLGVVGFKDGEGSIEHFPARHNHNVESRLRVEKGLVAPEQLPRETFCAISANSRSQLAAGRYSQPRVRARVRDNDDGHEPRVNPDSSRIRTFKLRAAANSLMGRQAARLRHHYPSSATVSRFRPLVRRRFNTIRPFLVDIRTLNPCAFLRRRVFG
jgi:hypothetical protein